MEPIIGIDVAKHELAIYADGKHYIIENDKKSLHEWFSHQAELVSATELVAYEATGGYEKTLAHYLEEHKLPGRRLHANHVRAYAEAMGIKAKTDKLDAKVIADFAAVRKVKPKSDASAHPKLLGLVQRREQLLDQEKQDRNRLETAENRYLIKDIEAHIKFIKKRLVKLNEAMEAYINGDPELKAYVDRLTSIPGVGLIVAVSLIVYLPELTESDDKALACLAGLAPINKDSGSKVGKRKIYGGRSQVRRVLYMAALSAKTHNPNIKEFYNRLSEKGKPFKVVITAAMRKLLLIIRSVARREEPWQSERLVTC